MADDRAEGGGAEDDGVEDGGAEDGGAENDGAEDGATEDGVADDGGIEDDGARDTTGALIEGGAVVAAVAGDVVEGPDVTAAGDVVRGTLIVGSALAPGMLVAGVLVGGVLVARVLVGGALVEGVLVGGTTIAEGDVATEGMPRAGWTSEVEIGPVGAIEVVGCEAEPVVVSHPETATIKAEPVTVEAESVSVRGNERGAVDPDPIPATDPEAIIIAVIPRPRHCAHLRSAPRRASRHPSKCRNSRRIHSRRCTCRSRVNGAHSIRRLVPPRAERRHNRGIMDPN